MPYPGKITERATDAILQLITSEQCMFHSTHRCLTAEGMRQQPQQKVTAPQTSANSLPRVTDVVRGEEGSEKEADAAQGSGEHAESSSKGESREKGAAGSLHADTLGDAELAAFMRLTGKEILLISLRRSSVYCLGPTSKRAQDHSLRASPL